jgi:hypothetical protein
MKNKIFTFVFLILLGLNFAAPKIALAQFDGVGGSAGGSDSSLLCGETSINTAIGCINVLGSQEEFLGDLLRWAIGVGSGIAFLLIVYAGFMIMTSSGNPDRLKAGQELLTSALSGLILLIFSVFILNLIGVKILQIPGFGSFSGLGGGSK